MSGRSDHDAGSADSRSPSSPPWLARDRRPDGVTDATVDATGKLSEALEWIERARGRLYDFHQMMGHADQLLGDAADLLERAGHPDWATQVRASLVGRNVLQGRWTFQIVEEYDATYWGPARLMVHEVEADLVGGQRHVFESEMKEHRRTHGAPHHESRPALGE